MVSASCLVSELSVSELVCQRGVCEAVKLLYLSLQLTLVNFLFTVPVQLCSVMIICDRLRL